MGKLVKYSKNYRKFIILTFFLFSIFFMSVGSDPRLKRRKNSRKICEKTYENFIQKAIVGKMSKAQRISNHTDI